MSRIRRFCVLIRAVFGVIEATKTWKGSKVELLCHHLTSWPITTNVFLDQITAKVIIGWYKPTFHAFHDWILAEADKESSCKMPEDVIFKSPIH